MEATYSIIATLREEKRINSKRALIMLRITVNGRRVEISIKRKIDPERWDSHANRVRGNKEDAKEINSLIDLLTLTLNKIYDKLVENDFLLSSVQAGRYLTQADSILLHRRPGALFKNYPQV